MSGLKSVKNKVTSRVGRQLLVTRKHSPALLFGVGVAGVVTTVVLASRATLKMDEILRDAETKDEQIQSALLLEDKDYQEEEAKKDRATLRVQTALKVVKLYAPAVCVGIVSIGALSGSHIILSRRNVALTAAYTALDRGFKEYRERVVKEFGQEKDDEFRFGVVEREIAVDTDDGVAVKTVKDLDKASGKSIYARVFDETSSTNWERSSMSNRVFIQAQQNYANDLLRRQGHVFLNEVYDMLGLERSREGAVVGWVKNGDGDNYIDFGVFSGDGWMGRQFVNGAERSVWLDFNVDGVIWDKI